MPQPPKRASSLLSSSLYFFRVEVEGTGTLYPSRFTGVMFREAERRRTEQNREAQQTSATAMGQTAFADMFGRQEDGILAAGGEKGKSLIELQDSPSSAARPPPGSCPPQTWPAPRCPAPP